MHKQRLLLLADRLDAVPPAKFNIDTWAGCLPCGCALYHAGRMPEFAKLGFDGAILPRYEHKGVLLAGWQAADAFFGFTGTESLYLFSGTSYKKKPGPKEVAARIRAFVKKGKI